MGKWKSRLYGLLCPLPWLLALLTILSAAGLTVVFARGWDETPAAYAIYVLSFYTLSALTLFFCTAFPERFRQLRERVRAHPLGSRYMTDAAFKVRLSLYLSLGINLAYSVFKLVSGIRYRSLWIGAMAVYYILLSTIRFLLLYHMQRRWDTGIRGEYRSYRTAAELMLCITLMLSCIVLSMVLEQKAPAFSDVFFITSAAYTFYILTLSIVDLVRYRKYKSPVLSAAKAVRFVQALISLLSLEASMLVQFGDDDRYRRLMLSLSGAGVWAATAAISVYMIVRANQEMKKLAQP